MDWFLKNNIFRQYICLPNENVRLITNALENFKLNSIYLRGSIIDNKPIHQNADIDLYIIHNDAYINRGEVLDIVESLKHLNRFVDMHLIRLKSLEYDLPNRLLLFTRSIHIGGPPIHIKPVKFNYEMINQHWKVYNPSFTPDVMFSTVRSRVCALKNLTRCFGLISLIEKKIFTRDIQECLDYAETFDKTIHQYLLDNWNLVDYQRPMYLSKIKEFLMHYHHEIIRQIDPSVGANLRS